MDDTEILALYNRATQLIPYYTECGSDRIASDALQEAYRTILNKNPWYFSGNNKRGLPLYKETREYRKLKEKLLPKLRPLAKEQRNLHRFANIYSWVLGQLNAGISEETLRDIGYQF